MHKVLSATILCLLLCTSGPAAEDRAVIRGEYVEARTAEVFAGGCVMNSEAETAGRQAVMAWRVTRGTLDGVVLDGLAVVAAVAGDRNLGMREMGGEGPGAVRAIVTVDPGTTEAERRALVRLARELSGGLMAEILRVDIAPVRFTTTADYVTVSAADELRLTVNKTMTHDPSCGAMQWFKPFSSRLDASAIGMAEEHSYAGSGLGSKWSAPHKRSAFFGTFTY